MADLGAWAGKGKFGLPGASRGTGPGGAAERAYGPARLARVEAKHVGQVRPGSWSPGCCAQLISTGAASVWKNAGRLSCIARIPNVGIVFLCS